MKTFSGTFANGQKYMGVGKPEGAVRSFINNFDNSSLHHVTKNGTIRQMYGLNENSEILGTYQTKGEIDLEVKEEWVGKFHDNDGWPGYYNYMDDCKTLWNTTTQSLLSLLDRDSRMAFPLEENPYGGKPEYLKTGAFDEATTNQQIINIWRIFESQVRPKSFLIILVK